MKSIANNSVLSVNWRFSFGIYVFSLANYRFPMIKEGPNCCYFPNMQNENIRSFLLPWPPFVLCIVITKSFFFLILDLMHGHGINMQFALPYNFWSTSNYIYINIYCNKSVEQKLCFAKSVEKPLLTHIRIFGKFIIASI